MAANGRMTPEEKFMMLIARSNKGTRQKPAHIESEMQRSCKRWFDLQYPKLSSMLFAVPNGGARNAREAAPGVADLLLLVQRHGYGCLCMEFKTLTGRQSISQKQWQAATEAAGNKYVVIRSFGQFVNEIKKYLCD